MFCCVLDIYRKYVWVILLIIRKVLQLQKKKKKMLDYYRLKTKQNMER